LTTVNLASAKNTDNLCARLGDLQHSFPLDVLMVPSLVLIIAIGGECLLCDGFSLGETICFGSLEFIADRFGGLILSPMGGGWLERRCHVLCP
jgi:hypothetical protein